MISTKKLNTEIMGLTPEERKQKVNTRKVHRLSDRNENKIRRTKRKKLFNKCFK